MGSVTRRDLILQAVGLSADGPHTFENLDETGHFLIKRIIKIDETEA